MVVSPHLAGDPLIRSIVGRVIATPHMLAGAAAASKARSVSAALAIGALTHLALDAVPHRDYRLGAFRGVALTADLAIGTFATARLSRGSAVSLAGALGGVLPDVVSLGERVLGVAPIGWAHATIHSDSRPLPWCSAAIQGFTAVTAALVLGATARSAHRPGPHLGRG
jgi:hypothetical protein